MDRANSAFFIEDLQLGQEASLTKVISDADIRSFAEISQDNNPVHLDESYAAMTRFKKRIAHGMLTASLVSAVIGTRLPGNGTIYLGQTLRFKAPVYVGAEVRALVSVAEINLEKKRVRLNCRCEVGGQTVLEGEADVLVPSRS
jgi:3-hydroxybutyryl-CoA dehydratase